MIRIPGLTSLSGAAPRPDRRRRESSYLKLALKNGWAVLNGPEHPVPSFRFYTMAHDVAGFDGYYPKSASVLLHGKRIGRVHFDGAGGYARDDKGCIKFDAIEPPEDVEAGTVVLYPQKDVE